jgi:hypothetical protein
MLNVLLFIGAIMIGIVLRLLIPAKKKVKAKAIRLPKNYNDTSDARYAINEHGFLEEIHHDKLSRHSL